MESACTDPGEERAEDCGHVGHWLTGPWGDKQDNPMAPQASSSSRDHICSYDMVGQNVDCLGKIMIV